MGKSPFATKEVKTYHYPEPLDPKRETELAAAAEADDREYSPQIDADELEEDHWIMIRIPRSRGDVDRVADLTQSMVVLGGDGNASRFEQQIAQGNRGVFELLVESWSFDVEPTSANYARLDQWSGTWIAAALADAVGRGTQRDFGKKAKNSSKPPEPSEPVASEQPQEESA